MKNLSITFLFSFSLLACNNTANTPNNYTYYLTQDSGLGDAGFDAGFDSGISCSLEDEPIPCIISNESFLCKDGYKYCQDGMWAECIGIASYENP